MTIDEKIAVLQAYKEGKTIETFMCSSKKWEKVIDNVQFNFGYYDYRIKPEPHYRSFWNAREAAEAIKEHGSFVRLKGDNLCMNICQFDNSFLYLCSSFKDRTYEEVFRNYTFVDGTPFGKLVEE